jgi:hypothetical protein
VYKMRIENISNLHFPFIENKLKIGIGLAIVTLTKQCH